MHEIYYSLFYLSIYLSEQLLYLLATTPNDACITRSIQLLACKQETYLNVSLYFVKGFRFFGVRSPSLRALDKLHSFVPGNHAVRLQ